MSDHRTPGPLRVVHALHVETEKGAHGTFCLFTEPRVPVHPASYFYGGDISRETAEANATAAAAVDVMLRALGLALVAMGRAGAHCDLEHPQREAWEACRTAIKAATVQP